MKVRHLIEELQQHDPEADVRMEDYIGDHSCTVVARPIYRAEAGVVIEWNDGREWCEIVRKGDKPDGAHGTCVLLKVFDDDMDKPEWAEEEE